MYQKLVRKGVMGILEKEVGSFLNKFLTPIEKIWQPSDYIFGSFK
jgi:acyl-[acyl-carrier-protein] desaturase